jgi:ribosome-associated translation inhibitor RaiA
MDNTLTLQGFTNLDPSEIERLEELVEKNLKKIKFKSDYTNLRIELKQHKHSKEINHEINAVLFLKQSRINAEANDKNIYKALQNVFDKLLAEIEHKSRKLDSKAKA